MPRATWRRWQPRFEAFLERAFDPHAVGIRQLPFTVAYLSSFTWALVRNLPSDDDLLLWSGAGAVLALQLVAGLVPWRRIPTLWQALLPVAQMAALIPLEVGSADTSTYYGSLIFLPVVTLALQNRVIGLVLATLGSVAVTLILGFALDPGPWVRASRAVIVPSTAFLVALGVYGVTNRLRARTRTLQKLQVEQARTLATVRANRDELAALTDRLSSTSKALTGLVDAAHLHAVIAVTPDGRISVFNRGAEALLGYARTEALGRSIAEMYDPVELEQQLAAHGAAGRRALVLGEAATGGSSLGEWHFRRRDGEIVPVQVAVSRRPLDPDGQPSGYLFVATDISEQREEERLQEEFIGLVSHELRTPLTGILGYVELMRMGGGLTDEQLSDLDVIERNGHRLLRLVNDLLLSVQLSSGRFTLVHEAMDLAEVARSCAEAMAPAAQAADVTVVVEAAEPVRLHADPIRLAQVVENLLSNAVKFTPAGGTVTLRAFSRPEAEGGQLGVVEVADTGIGIGPDELDRLTERFYRSRAARGKRIRGIGLGLSITQAIVDAHHGTMTVSSTLGVGTTFVVEIPDEPPTPA